MKLICETRRFVWVVFALIALFIAGRAGASAADSYQSRSPAIVIAHLPWSGVGATQMFLRQEGGTQYLYVQQPSHSGFTVIDVTRPKRPRVLRRVRLETRTVMGSGLMMTETLVKPATAGNPLATGNAEGEPEDTAVPELVHVLNLNDPTHLQAVQQLGGSSMVLADDARGLTYVVNRHGIWILSHQRAPQSHP